MPLRNHSAFDQWQTQEKIRHLSGVVMRRKTPQAAEEPAGRKGIDRHIGVANELHLFPPEIDNPDR